MLRAPRLLVGLLALGLIVPALSFAADTAANGTIKGKVTTADGKAAANVTVRVLAPAAKKSKTADANKTAADDTPVKPAKKKAAPPVATATTDTDGNYTVEVPAGDYTVAVADKAMGSGRAKVSVTAGQTATADITLKEPKKAK